MSVNLYQLYFVVNHDDLVCRFKQTVELWFHFKGFFFAVLYKMWAFYSRNEKSDGGTDEDESHE